MFENNEIHHSQGLLQKREDIKRCSSCSSVYITDTECESCGLQFKFDFIGEPWGHLSFYQPMDNFYFMSRLEKLIYFIQGKKYRLYIRYELVLKRRFKNLLTYFLNHSDEDIDRRKFLFLELHQLVDEMNNLDLGKYISTTIKDYVIDSDNENVAHNSIYVSRITEWMKYNIKNNSKRHHLTIKLFGAIRIGYVLLIMVLAIIFILVGIKMFPMFIY